MTLSCNQAPRPRIVYSLSINHLYRTYLANKNTPSNRQTSPNTEYTNAYIQHNPTLVLIKSGVGPA